MADSTINLPQYSVNKFCFISANKICRHFAKSVVDRFSYLRLNKDNLNSQVMDLIRKIKIIEFFLI